MVQDRVSKGKSGVFQIEAKEGDDHDALHADFDLLPQLHAAAVIGKFSCTSGSESNNADLVDSFFALVRESKRVREGELSRAEDMLISQAHTLEAVFSNLMLRAERNMGKYPETVERYMKLALKAQNQCRMTLETLAEIKNPRPYIQNNRAQYQQVNNSPAASHAENKIQQNELLEQDDESHWMDARTATETSRDDRQLEAMGAKHRP